MALDISSVGATAVLTAHLRALESTRWDALFDDPWAEKLVASSDVDLSAVSLAGVLESRIYPSVAVRTHYLDLWCGPATESGVQQIVVLGAGLDTRALRLGWLDQGIEVWELDRADVVEFKTSALAVESEHWHAVTADLRDDGWFDRLTATGFDPERPALWICEGVFMYLGDDVARGAVRTIADRSREPELLGVHFGLGALWEEGTRSMSDAAGAHGYGFLSVLAPEPAQWLGPSWSVRDCRSIADHGVLLGRRIPYDEAALGEKVTWLFTATTTHATDH
ncbi:class I SAM-dependent methyltransferase [Rhodococcus qingshengii]|uniref:class I SAM-dependent methyltransferase n=1 Tax=Rhodococcus qingshengii TaxID=334542 RepID=UPI00365CA9DA